MPRGVITGLLLAALLIEGCSGPAGKAIEADGGRQTSSSAHAPAVPTPSRITTDSDAAEGAPSTGIGPDRDAGDAASASRLSFVPAAAGVYRYRQTSTTDAAPVVAEGRLYVSSVERRYGVALQHVAYRYGPGPEGLLNMALSWSTPEVLLDSTDQRGFARQPCFLRRPLVAIPSVANLGEPVVTSAPCHETRDDKGRLELEVTLLGDEPVEVEGVTYATIVVRQVFRRTDGEGRSGTQEVTAWFSPEHGLELRAELWVTEPNGRRYDVVEEIVSLTPEPE